MPPRPKSAIAELKAWAMKRLTRILWVAGVIAGLSAGIVGAAKALPILEPWWFAHCGYVRESSGPLLNRIIDVQLAQNDSHSERLVQRQKQYELELQSPQVQQLPQYKKVLQDQVERVNNELKTIEEKNKSLLNEKLSK